MAYSCFTVRTTTRAQVKEDILKLTLRKHYNGQYQHDNIVTFANAVLRILKTSYNPSDPGNGMMKLIDSSTGVPPSAILTIKSNNMATISTVLTTATRDGNQRPQRWVPVQPTSPPPSQHIRNPKTSRTASTSTDRSSSVQNRAPSQPSQKRSAAMLLTLYYAR